jgi:hypothetical protein
LQEQQHHQQQPLVWCQGLFTGTFVDEVSSRRCCSRCWYTAVHITLQEAVHTIVLDCKRMLRTSPQHDAGSLCAPCKQVRIIPRRLLTCFSW